MSQLQRGGRVVVVAERRKISIIPQANISYNDSIVIVVLCRSVVAAMPLLLGRDFQDRNRPLAVFRYLGTQSYSQGGEDARSIVKMRKICQWEEPQLTVPAIQESKRILIGKANSVCVIPAENARKIFGFSFITHEVERAVLGRYQTANMEASQEASLVLNQLCESIIKSINSQCERLRQMDEHLSAIWSRERVRFIFEACLSHFSCLVLEGRARICDFSNARDLQLFYSV